MTYLSTVTFFHTAACLLALVAGIFAMAELLRPGISRSSTSWFFWTAFIASATGFLFPLTAITPAVVVGVVALIVLLAVFIAGRKSDHSRMARRVYAAGMVASLYLLVFVGVVQAFQKIGFLNHFAPMGTELPFAATQLAALVMFLGLGVVVARTYRPTEIRLS
jgi:hypothetical protein